MLTHIQIAHLLWQQVVKPGDTVIDATAGNGHDSLFLASLGAKVIAFDIQPQAIENTRTRLGSFDITLHNICHSRMKEVVSNEAIKLVVFNLGYLPGGDKSITTLLETTLLAIKTSLEIATNISITCYPGHDEGLIEEKAILDLLSTLDPKKWSISSHTFLNRQRHPHLLFITPR
ncbi:MAG: class I SAM-dependent methyltransferase [Verrucomicrobia bacterium]|nr:class I SAM-dependent methyltransferase [Verrucomicrobiota bacterium]MBS0637764.1 class I SAM-dependent methyltransferase [Verrucomicrobiota bacterium]